MDWLTCQTLMQLNGTYGWRKQEDEFKPCFLSHLERWKIAINDSSKRSSSGIELLQEILKSKSMESKPYSFWNNNRFRGNLKVSEPHNPRSYWELFLLIVLNLILEAIAVSVISARAFTKTKWLLEGPLTPR